LLLVFILGAREAQLSWPTLQCFAPLPSPFSKWKGSSQRPTTLVCKRKSPETSFVRSWDVLADLLTFQLECGVPYPLPPAPPPPPPLTSAAASRYSAAATMERGRKRKRPPNGYAVGCARTGPTPQHMVGDACCIAHNRESRLIFDVQVNSMSLPSVPSAGANGYDPTAKLGRSPSAPLEQQEAVVIMRPANDDGSYKRSCFWQFVFCLLANQVKDAS